MLGMALSRGGKGLKDKVTASTCIQCPMKCKVATENLKNIFWGLPDKNFGKRHKQIYH